MRYAKHHSLTRKVKQLTLTIYSRPDHQSLSPGSDMESLVSPIFVALTRETLIKEFAVVDASIAAARQVLLAHIWSGCFHVIHRGPPARWE